MKKILYIALTLVLITGCRKESDKFEGPSIEELYGDFAILTPFAVDRSQVDFAAGEVAIFTAEFSKPVQWTITITGETTGAQKTITAKTKSINADSATWNGSTTKFPVFGVENCKAMLTIEGEPDTSILDIQVLSPKPNEGLVLADFENGMDPDWTVFIQTGADMDFGIKTDPIAPHGSSYLNMKGTVDWDWLIGLIDFNAAAYTTDPTMPLSSDPERVYFNVLVYGEPANNQSLILFQFKEDENEDGNFDGNSEDIYALEVWVDWEGWKLVSVKYSDLEALVNGQPATPNGNGNKEPDKLGLVSMLHLANPAQGSASTKADYIIFSPQPLEP